MNRHAIAAACIAWTSCAGSGHALGALRFSDLDVNRDNALTRAEAGLLPEVTARWDQLDRDGDGRLNRGEYAACSRPAPAAGQRD
ncbi:MAG: hypothetical protein R3F42_07900 [Pseudomonadota bacterium]